MREILDVRKKINEYNEDLKKTIDDKLVVDALSSYKYIIGMNFTNTYTEDLTKIISYIKEAFSNKGSDYYLNDKMIEDYPVKDLFDNYLLQYFTDTNLKSDFFNFSLLLVTDIIQHKYSKFYQNKEQESEYVNNLLDKTTPYHNFKITDIINILEKSSDPDFFISSYMKNIISARDKKLVKDITNDNNIEYIMEFMENHFPKEHKFIENKNKFLFNTITQHYKNIIPDNVAFDAFQHYFSTISTEEKNRFNEYFKDEFSDIFFYSKHMLQSNKQDDFSNYETAFIHFLQVSNHNELDKINILKSVFDSFSSDDMEILSSRKLYTHYMQIHIDLEKAAINKHIIDAEHPSSFNNKKRL